MTMLFLRCIYNIHTSWTCVKLWNNVVHDLLTNRSLLNYLLWLKPIKIQHNRAIMPVHVRIWIFVIAITSFKPLSLAPFQETNSHLPTSLVSLCSTWRNHLNQAERPYHFLSTQALSFCSCTCIRSHFPASTWIIPNCTPQGQNIVFGTPPIMIEKKNTSQ